MEEEQVENLKDPTRYFWCKEKHCWDLLQGAKWKEGEYICKWGKL